MDCSTPGFPVFHHLPEFAQTLSWWCHPSISSSAALFSFCLQSCPASGFFPMSWLFESGGQSIGASATVLPISIQGWLISFRTDWFDLLAVQRTLKSLLQRHSYIYICIQLSPYKDTVRQIIINPISQIRRLELTKTKHLHHSHVTPVLQVLLSPSEAPCLD